MNPPQIQQVPRLVPLRRADPQPVLHSAVGSVADLLQVLGAVCSEVAGHVGAKVPHPAPELT
jgi:hypothetical protein